MIYVTIITTFALLSGLLFMLVKTWLMVQFIWIREGKYNIRPKDRIWLWPGWVSTVVFMVWVSIGCVILLNRF